MASIFRAVSSRDSPFFVEDVDDEKDMMSADSRFAANSKLSFVRVEFSKKAKTMVFPRSVGTFFISRLLTSRNDVAVWRIFSTFSGDNGRTDSKSLMVLMFL